MDKRLLSACRRAFPGAADIIRAHAADKQAQLYAVQQFNTRQLSLLKRYSKKRFVVSTDFFSAAVEELRKSFVLGEEGGMLAFFKPEGDTLKCSEFYGTDWIEKNGYGLRSPCNTWCGRKDLDITHLRTTFGWRSQKLLSLVDGRPKDELLLLCHTHFNKAEPSPGDLSSSTSSIIISFATTSGALEKLARRCICLSFLYKTVQKPPERSSQISDAEWKETMDAFASGRLKERVHNKIPLRVWAHIVAECKPTARLFYKDRKNNKRRIPLYLEGAELL